jgi:hypothetical protein
MKKLVLLSTTIMVLLVSQTISSCNATPKSTEINPISPAPITSPPTTSSTPPQTEYSTEEALKEVIIPNDYFKVPVNKYTSTKNGFTVSYPQTWTYEENVYKDDLSGYGVDFWGEYDNLPIIITIVAKNWCGTPLEDITKNYADNTEKAEPTWTVTRNSTSIEDPKTYLVQIDGSFRADDGHMYDIYVNTVWFCNSQTNTLYVFEYEAFGQTFKEKDYIGIMYAMLNSFKFIQ